MKWKAPVTPGTYALTVSASDNYDPPVVASVVVQVENFLWVKGGGGSTPCNGLMGQEFASIQAALDQARNAPSTAACVMGATTFAENLVVPSSPNTPDLLGGYNTTGGLDATLKPRIESSVASGMTFAAGYAGLVLGVDLAQAASFAAAGEASVITVVDASPKFLGVTVTGTAGAPLKALRVRGTGSAPVNPSFTGGLIVGPAYGATPLVDATLVEVSRLTGAALVTPSLHATSLSLTECDGTCRGIHLMPGASAVLDRGSSVSTSSKTGNAFGVDIDGDAASTATAVIDGNNSIWVDTGGGEVAVAIRMDHAQSVSITGNTGIGMYAAGTQFGNAIADVEFGAGGGFTAGGSSLVTIADNGTISGGSLWNTSCTAAVARPARKRGGLARPVCLALVEDLRRDATRVAAHIELPPFMLDADRPDATDRYGICHDDGRILVRLCHATTGRPLRYSALVDTVVHELAHLRHLDHGPRWEELYERMLEWCRAEGIYRPRPVAPPRALSPPRQLALRF